jgi:hypothetical protein
MRVILQRSRTIQDSASVRTRLGYERSLLYVVQSKSGGLVFGGVIVIDNHGIEARNGDPHWLKALVV